MRQVLLTDKNTEILKAIAYELDGHFQVHFCNNAAQLPEVIEQIKPDLMVLDLSMPGCDIVYLQDLLRDRELPLIIATTIRANDYLINCLSQLSVKRLIHKPLRPTTVAARLLELELLLDDVPDRSIRCAVYELLLHIGVPLSHYGFFLLAEGAIFAALRKEFSMTDDLYPHVAQICGGSAESVEISMRRCIEYTFKTSAPYNWRGLIHIPSPHKYPTNAGFIKQLALHIQKMEHRL